jgi:hypothetical protein
MDYNKVSFYDIAFIRVVDASRGLAWRGRSMDYARTRRGLGEDKDVVYRDIAFLLNGGTRVEAETGKAEARMRCGLDAVRQQQGVISTT